MTSDLLADAHAVILPILEGLHLHDWASEHLRRGGQTLLLGETRDEYVAREMSRQRRETERGEMFHEIAEKATQAANGPVLIAVDQELGGITRLHDLVPALPRPADAVDMSEEELVAAARATGAGARSLGVSMFLSPVLDVLTGPNTWLSGRTMGADTTEVARIGSCFVRGVQEAGVIATAKHFPGFAELAADPAQDDVVLAVTDADLERGLEPFRAAVDAGVAAVMLGPANVSALDEFEPAATSANVVRLLRDKLGFGGLIVSDDLDAPATRRDRFVADTAVASLAAGADLLLLAGGPQIAGVAQDIAAAVATGTLDRGRLQDAAERTRAHILS